LWYYGCWVSSIGLSYTYGKPTIGKGRAIPPSIVTVKSRSLPVESVHRYGQGIYRLVSVKGLKQKGEIATVSGSRAFIDGSGRQSMTVCMVRSVDTARETSTQSRSKARERRRSYLSGSFVFHPFSSATHSPQPTQRSEAFRQLLHLSIVSAGCFHTDWVMLCHGASCVLRLAIYDAVALKAASHTLAYASRQCICY